MMKAGTPANLDNTNMKKKTWGLPWSSHMVEHFELAKLKGPTRTLGISKEPYNVVKTC